MAKLFLKHITGYSYTDNVSESTNRIMLFPYNDTNQHLVNHNISITGNPELFTYIDHFNNRVGVFNFLDPHSSLIIKSEAEIITSKIKFPEDTLDSENQWKILENLSKQINYLEFMIIDPLFSFNEAFNLVNELKLKSITPFQICQYLNKYIFENFKYKTGITNVYSQAKDVWEQKTGVCQDFANVLIQLLRIAKIPARYVSGYVCAKKNIRGYSATHAWTEAFIPNYGWIGLDPTNNLIASDLHVRLAVGRDYNDCSPVKGVFKGEETQKMSVNVYLGSKEEEVSNKELVVSKKKINKVKTKEKPQGKNSFMRNLQVIQQQQQQQQ